MLSNSDRDELADELVAAAGGNATTLSQIAQASVSEINARVNYCPIASVYARLLVAEAEKDTQDEQTGLFALLQYVMTDKIDAILDRVRQQLANRPAAGPALLEAARDHRSQRLINRSHFRQQFSDMMQQGLNVLSVIGENLSGKSYSAQFLQYFAIAYQARVMVIDVREDELPNYDADDLLKSFLQPLGVFDPSQIPDPKKTNPNRWVKELRLNLIAKLATIDRNTWFVLDHFGDQSVHQNARRLVRQLAGWFNSRPPAFPHKMFVLGFEQNQTSPEGLADSIGREFITAAERVDVEEYYERLMGEDREDGAVTAAVDEVYRQVERSEVDPPTIEMLCDAIQRVDTRLGI